MRANGILMSITSIPSPHRMIYQWTWIPAKVGYDVYDEGIAIFSKTAFEDTEQFYISQSEDYNNWKARKILGIRTNNKWFYSVHMV